MDPRPKDLSNIDVFSGEGFILWKYQVSAMFSGKNLMDIVNGTEASTVQMMRMIVWQQAINLKLNLFQTCSVVHLLTEFWDKNIHVLQEHFYECKP